MRAKPILSIFLALFMLGASGIKAQRLAYIDSQIILKKIPEYAQAQAQIDNSSKQWEAEVSKLRKEIDEMEKSYQSEKVLLTPKLQEEKESEIEKKHQEAIELQRKYFGPEGELFKKRQTLIQPIQDQIFNAVQDVAQRKRYDMVFDKAGAITLLYASKAMDISEEVLQKMGY